MVQLTELVFIAVIGGSLLAEFSGYVWHRWVAHLGILSWLPNDFLRRRHFDHHESKDKYPPGQLRGMIYRESCEITFNFLAVILLPLIVFTMWAGWIPWSKGISLLIGATAYGIVVQGTLHSWYHLEDVVLRKHLILRVNLMWNLFQWLRDCHEIHHEVHANYFILNPAPDLIFGTLRTRKGIAKKLRQNLFPAFNSKLSSSCGKSIFRLQGKFEG